MTNIKDAIASDEKLSGKSVTSFPQGSYRNRTNVRKDSDVDVCVLCDNTFFYDLADGLTASQAGIVPATYHFDEYKNDVQRALQRKFSGPNVRRGSKAFDINERTIQVDADAAPCFRYSSYFLTPSGELKYHPGTALIADDTGKMHTNFPDQQYKNGVAKNDATGRRFKKSVRILKKLCYEMEEQGYASAGSMASFLIECLVWNVPDHLFETASLREMTQSILVFLWDNTRTEQACRHWTEENGIKYLFHPSQAWNRDDVNRFVVDAWKHVED